MSFELLVRSGRSANKTEALSKTHNNICTLVLRNARTNPCFSLFVSWRRNWDFGASHLCHIGTNPASPGWRSTLVCKHTRSAITLTSSLQIPASLSLFLGGEVGFWCCAPVPLCGTNPAYAQAGAPLLYANMPVPLLRHFMPTNPCGK